MFVFKQAIIYYLSTKFKPVHAVIFLLICKPVCYLCFFFFCKYWAFRSEVQQFIVYSGRFVFYYFPLICPPDASFNHLSVATNLLEIRGNLTKLNEFIFFR